MNYVPKVLTDTWTTQGIWQDWSPQELRTPPWSPMSRGLCKVGSASSSCSYMATAQGDPFFVKWYPGGVQAKGAERLPYGRPGQRDLELVNCNSHHPAPLRLASEARRTVQQWPAAPKQTQGHKPSSLSFSSPVLQLGISGTFHQGAVKCTWEGTPSLLCRFSGLRLGGEGLDSTHFRNIRDQAS